MVLFLFYLRVSIIPILFQAELNEFLSATLRHFDSFSFEGMTNVLRFVRKLFASVSSNPKLQREIVQQLLGQTIKSGLVIRSALTRSPKVWEASADFFRHLLNSKVKIKCKQVIKLKLLKF